MEKEKQITVKGDGDQSQEIDYFGGCPECGRNDGYLNVGREHWGMCDKHKTKWRIGSNLFSSWKEETADQWKQNAKRLSTYRKVEPIRDKKEVKKMVVEEKPRLLIKANNTIAKEYCPICRELHKDADIPWAIFVESSNACVCDRCVEKHDPQLGKMLFDGVDKWNKKLEEKDKEKVRRQKVLVKLIIDNGFTSEDLRGLSGRAFERNQDGEVEEVHYPITERSCESVRVSEEVPFW